MKEVIDFIFTHAPHAHWLVFSLLMLAGFNIPISEDLMIIISALLAATVVPENLIKLFAAVFLGCYLSDSVCYWIGRKWGPRLWNIRWFAKTFNRDKIDQIHQYYAKYGFRTLLFGRFIPFGVRNALFLTAGLGKMPYRKFLVSDGIACAFSNIVLFTLAYQAGRNYETLLQGLKTFNLVLFSSFVVLIIGVFWYKRKKS